MSSRYRTDIQWFSRLCTLLPCLMTVKLLFQLLFCQLIILGFRRDVPIDPLISFRATCFLWETLIGHFIGYIFLVLGWIPVWFKTVLIFHSTDSMKHSSEILVIIDIILAARPWCKSPVPLQRCSTALRSGDCGAHTGTVKLLSCQETRKCCFLLEIAIKSKERSAVIKR